MRVLGIDCGTARTGYGVIESDGRRHTLIAAGTIRTRTKDPLAQRLKVIAEGLRQVIAEHSPESAAVEAVFHAANTKTALKLAHARGVALLSTAEAEIECAEYSPLEIKNSVVGYGRAEKAQVQMMVASILGLAEPLAEDASDAVAAAICHASKIAYHGRIGAGGKGVTR